MFKTKKISLLTGFFLAVCLLLTLFVSPTATFAKTTKKVVETKIVTSPENPKGQNDWYTSVTMVELNSNTTGSVYFQWNETTGKWSKYKQPVRAYRGENTLYYYSVSQGGVKEAVKSKVIKVDYSKPTLVSAKIVSWDAAAQMNFQSQSDVVKYKIYKKIDGHYRLIDSTKTDSYLDKSVKVGKTYVYKVVAVDQAGLESTGAQLVVKIVEPVIVAKIDNSSMVAIKTVILPKQVQQIGQGSSVVAQAEPVVEKTVETAPITSSKTVTPVRNWSRLLVAIVILLVAAGAAIGGYYAYEWWTNRTQVQDKPKEKKSNSRW
jgi:hypothetical protein